MLINIALYAVFASFIALGQGNLWLIAGLHAGWNYFQGNIYGLPVSGNAEASSLFAFGPAAGSSDLVSGGDFGVEASLVGTADLGGGVRGRASIPAPRQRRPHRRYGEQHSGG